MTAKHVIMPQLNAAVAIAQCKPDGYVHARSPRDMHNKRIWYAHWECYYHFACRALYHYAKLDKQRVALHALWAGLVPHGAIDTAVGQMFDSDRLQVIAVHDYDGRFVSECVQCGRVRVTPKVRTCFGRAFVNERGAPWIR